MTYATGRPVRQWKLYVGGLGPSRLSRLSNRTPIEHLPAKKTRLTGQTRAGVNADSVEPSKK